MKWVFDDLINLISPINVNINLLHRGSMDWLDPLLNYGESRFTRKYGNDLSIAVSNTNFSISNIIGKNIFLSNKQDTYYFSVGDILKFSSDYAKVESIDIENKSLLLDKVIDADNFIRFATKLEVVTASPLTVTKDIKLCSFDLLGTYKDYQIAPFEIKSITESTNVYEIDTDLNSEDVWVFTYPLYSGEFILPGKINCGYFDIFNSELPEKDYFKIKVMDLGDNLIDTLDRGDIFFGDIDYNEISLWDINLGSVKEASNSVHFYTNADNYFELEKSLYPEWEKDQDVTWLFKVVNHSVNPAYIRIIFEENNTEDYFIAGSSSDNFRVTLKANLSTPSLKIQVKGSDHVEMSSWGLFNAPKKLYLESSLHSFRSFHTGLFLKSAFLKYDYERDDPILNNGYLT